MIDFRGGIPWIQAGVGGETQTCDSTDFFEPLVQSLKQQSILIIIKEGSKQSIFSHSCSSLKNKKKGKQNSLNRLSLQSP